MNGKTERVIDSLVRDLPPVRPIPPLRRMALWVLGVGATAGGLGIWLHGANPRLLETAARYPSFLVIGLGLLGVAGGGVIAALAGSVPGRESEARVASGVMVAGALAAWVLGGALAFAGPAGQLPRASLLDLGICSSLALLLSLPAAACVLAFVLRGAPGRPLACLAAAAAGAVALGGLANHLSCDQLDALHQAVGHAGAPVLGLVLLALPVWWLSRRAVQPGSLH